MVVIVKVVVIEVAVGFVIIAEAAVRATATYIVVGGSTHLVSMINHLVGEWFHVRREGVAVCAAGIWRTTSLPLYIHIRTCLG